MATSDDSTPTRPAIRAVQPRSLVASLDEALTPSEHAELMRRLDDELLKQLRATLKLSWFPLDAHMRLSTTILDLMGAERFVTLFRRTFERSLQTSMLRGLFETLRRLSGDPVHTTLKHSPRVYSYVVRDAGSMRYTPDGGRAALVTVEDWPVQFSTECWMLGTQGCLIAVMAAVSDQPTELSVVSFDETTGRIEYRATWG